MINPKSKIFLAPLAGITDSTFRIICREHGADVVYTELISADAIYHNSKKTFEMMKFSQKERPIGIQLFGSDIEIMANAVRKSEELSPDFIDINLGCSIKKINKQGHGAALLRDLRKMKDIMISAVSSSSIPVSAKMRIGWNKDRGVDIAQILEKSGVSFIAVHGRTAIQKFEGESDWESIKKIKESVKIPVIGNGDIFTAEQAVEKWKFAKTDSIMIGRGSFGNPWIFTQIKELVSTGKIQTNPDIYDRMEILEKHYKMACANDNDDSQIKLMRKHFHWYVYGIPDTRHYKEIVNNTVDLQKVLNIIEEIKKGR